MCVCVHGNPVHIHTLMYLIKYTCICEDLILNMKFRNDFFYLNVQTHRWLPFISPTHNTDNKMGRINMVIKHGIYVFFHAAHTKPFKKIYPWRFNKGIYETCYICR